MSQTAFRIAFEGEPFDQGEIAVSELAPALLALGDVVQSANRALNGDRAEARLKLRATNLGSFEALLSIDISMVDAIKDLLDTVSDNPERIVAANNLLDLLIKGGTVVGGTVLSLFAAVKFLKGKNPDKIEKLGDTHTSITLNQTTIVVDNKTLHLLQDRPTREALELFGDKALGVSGVTSIKLGERGALEDLELTSADKIAFKVPSSANEEPIVEVIQRDTLLKIVTSHFRDGYKWRFTDGGERPFTADIEDQDFLNAVLSGKVNLSANDTLRCRIREEQSLTSSGLIKDVKIEKVLEHILGARQLKLI